MAPMRTSSPSAEKEMGRAREEHVEERLEMVCGDGDDDDDGDYDCAPAA